MASNTNTNNAKLFEIIRRLHRYGVTWLVVFVILFVANQGTDLLQRLLVTVADVLLLMLFTSFYWYVLIEKLLDTKRYVPFSILALVTFVGFAAASTFMEIEISQFFYQEEELEYYVIFLMRIIWYIIIAIVVFVFYFQQKENENIRVQEHLQTEKLSAELLYLKTQINPHFLFNAINNIYSMVYMKQDQAPENILKLSEMLRYVLVDCQAETIPLHKEIKNIENFVDFQSVTIGSKKNITFEVDVEDQDYMIAPMLMQPIVENCFKYSRLNTNPDGFVELKITQKGDELIFDARNSVSVLSVVDVKKTGIGIENVKRRLDLYYNEDYDLMQTQVAGVFVSVLHLKKRFQEKNINESFATK